MADGSRQAHSRPTLKTVAREAGVSTTTVSFVLSGRADAGISEATAQRVHEAVKRLGYFPNSSARAVRTGRTGLVMLSLNMLSDPWSLALADAVNSAAKKAGITSMILADGDWFSALELQSADVAYVGLGPDREDDARKLATMVERGQKIVVFDELAEPKGFDVIRSNSLPGCSHRDRSPSRTSHRCRLPHLPGERPEQPVTPDGLPRRHGRCRTERA